MGGQGYVAPSNDPAELNWLTPLWLARSGAGFTHVDLPHPIGRICVAICMDINPEDFVAPWDSYELANYAAKHEVDLLVLCAAWLAAPPADPAAPVDEAEDDDEHPDGPSLDTLNYWAHRLTPLHDPPPPADPGAAQRRVKETYFVACNRVGQESGASSCLSIAASDPDRCNLLSFATRFRLQVCRHVDRAQTVAAGHGRERGREDRWRERLDRGARLPRQDGRVCLVRDHTMTTRSRRSRMLDELVGRKWTRLGPATHRCTGGDAAPELRAAR